MFLIVKINKAKILSAVVIILIIAFVVGFGHYIIIDRGVLKHFGIPVNSFEEKENSIAMAFIRSFGWVVQEKPVEVEEFRIPEEFNALYKKYNEYQKDIGLDLTPYRGKMVKRYTYKVENYPLPQEYKGQTVYADIIIYNEKVIAGDLKTNQINGFMVSLKGNLR